MLLSFFKDLPVKKHGALRCPDFPPPDKTGSDKAACRLQK